MKRDTMDSSMRRPKRLRLRFRTWDRLSTLPDEIICDILSRLLINTAVSTSVLSRRWRHLWAGVSRVKYVVECIVKKKKKKKASLKRYTGLFSMVQKLTCQKLQLFDLDLSQIPHLAKAKLMTVESIFRQVYDRNVEEFILKTDWFSVLSLPAFLLHSPSLVTLNLYCNFTIQLPENGTVYLPNLKHLLLHHLRNIPTWLEPLFRSSPLLESFDLHARYDPPNTDIDFPQSLTLFAPALTSLKINIHTDNNMILTRTNLYIDAPKLSTLDISDNTNFYYFVHDHCPAMLLNACLNLTNRVVFVGDISKPLAISQRYLHQMSTFVPGMYAVRHLEVTVHASSNIFPTLYNSANIITHGVCPMFGNITRFTTTWRNIVVNGWTHLLALLHLFPYLNHLQVETSNVILEKEWEFCPPDSVPNCLVSHLKTINIISATYKVKFDRNSLAAYILSHALVLEELHFSVRFSCKEFDLQLMRKRQHLCRSLFNLPKCSSCEVVFSGPSFTESSRTYHELNGSTSHRIAW